MAAPARVQAEARQASGGAVSSATAATSAAPAASPSASATSRSLASATIGSPAPARMSMPTSRAAASAIASCPLPPSTTIRSGSFQVPASSPPSPRAPEPPREHLVHRGEVVVVAAVGAAGRARGADLVRPVAALVGAAVDEDDHRGDGGEPLQVRDVVTLDDARQVRQLEAPLQLAERDLHVGARVAPGREAGRGVLVGELDQLLAIAPLRDEDLHLLVPTRQCRPPFVEPLGLQRRVLDLDRQQHLVGWRRAEVVVEADERGDQLGVGELLPGERVAAAAVQLSVADRHHHDLERDPLAVVADHVLIEEVARHHPLLLQRHLQGLDLVADLRRHLELGPRCRVAHARAQPVEQLVALAVEKQSHVAHLIAVRLARDGQHAGGRAALDLVLQAGALAVVQHVVGAGAQLEVAVHHPQRLPARRRRVVGPEVVGAVVAEPPGHLQARPLPVRVEPQHQEVLVVRELDVEARLVALDERVLEEQRLLLVAGDDRLDVGDDARRATARSRGCRPRPAGSTAGRGCAAPQPCRCRSACRARPS